MAGEMDEDARASKDLGDARPFGTVAVRPFRPDDLEPVAAIMRQTLGLPQVDARLIARDFLLAPAFSPDQLLVADAGAQPIGFLLAPRHDDLGPADTAWIAAFGVLAEHRRQGVATALLRTALTEMRRQGISRVDVADVPVRYLLPGVDRDRFAHAFRLLVDVFGFAVRDEVASMGLHLSDLRPAEANAAIRPCRPGEFPLLRSFLQAEFDAGWWAFFERSILARLNGSTDPSDVICWWEDEVPAGTVHYRNNRFGPLAVSARLRRRGIGEQLTQAALAGIRSGGFADASFMIGSEAVQPFYQRLGFHTLRRFSRLTLTL